MAEFLQPLFIRVELYGIGSEIHICVHIYREVIGFTA